MNSNSGISDEVYLWRESVPIVKLGEYYSVIQDRGKLQKAIKSSNNWYLFSENKIGTEPLVLIGTPVGILDFLSRNVNSGIENRIAELPDIYMGITKYKPKARFKGLFPMEDFMTQFIKQIALDYLPFDTNQEAINVLFDASSNFQAFKEQLEFISGSNSKKNKFKNIYYVKFSYLPENGMKKIAESKASFAEILLSLQRKLAS